MFSLSRNKVKHIVVRPISTKLPLYIPPETNTQTIIGLPNPKTYLCQQCSSQTFFFFSTAYSCCSKLIYHAATAALSSDKVSELIHSMHTHSKEHESNLSNSDSTTINMSKDYYFMTPRFPIHSILQQELRSERIMLSEYSMKRLLCLA